MKKNYLFLFVILLYSSLVVGQKVTLTPTVVNGVGYSSGPINLGSTSISTISLSVKVEFPADPGNNGTINLYYEKAAGLGAIIPSGGNGGNLFFGGGKIGLSNFVISLNSAQFNTSGGYIYAEYKSSTGLIYKSSAISVIKNGTSIPPPSTSNKYEIVPYAGIPLLPKLGYFAYNVVSKEWIDSGDQLVNANAPFYQTANLRERATFDDGSVRTSKKVIFSVTNFLANYYNVRINSIISENQYLTNYQDPQTIIGNEATESHTSTIENKRGNIITNKIYNYQWQTRIKIPLLWTNLNDSFFYLYGWRDIPNANGINYTPPKTDVGMEYRRLNLEKFGDIAENRRCTTSNVISIVPLINDTTKNIICCDQTISERTLPNPIIGDNPFISESHYFQWQVSRDNNIWEDLYGENEKDYNTINNRRSYTGGQLFYYRRIVFSFSENKYYSSNVVKIDFVPIPAPPRDEPLKIYPNPTTSILNIETTLADFTTALVTVLDTTGNKVTPNNLSIVNASLITMNVSNLPLGVYMIEIKTGGERRQYYYRTIKFIKQ